MSQKEQSILLEQVVNANYSKLKYISLISLGFSAFLLITDFLIRGAWHEEYLYYYKLLDIIFTVISISAFSFFWLFENKNKKVRKAGIILYPFLFLIWSAVLSGIDFSIMGFSTFLIVLLSIAFFLYLNPIFSIVFFFSSCFVIVTTLYFRGDLNDNYLPLIFMIIPIVIFSILVSIKNYKSKLSDLINQKKVIALNEKLQYSNENLEGEVEKRTSEILEVMKKAEESDRLKTAFMNNMSHEVRTPLNAIVGFSQLISNSNHLPEKRKSFSKIISRSSDKLIGILTDVIEISQIQSKSIQLEFTEIDIVLYITNTVNGFMEMAEEKDIAFVFNQNIPLQKCIVQTDIEKLKKILSHLVDNAIKFTHRGSVEISCAVKDGNLQISVSDTGIGISEEIQENIFKPFHQVEIESHKNYGGTGLGLSLAKAYIELLHGTLTLKSEIGIGTTISASIPLSILHKEPVKKVIREPKKNGSTILIAEDEYVNYLYLEELLVDFNVKILHATNGQEALEFCRNDASIGLVLMDIKMPIMDGHTASKLIRELHPALPIIAQSAYTSQQDRKEFLSVFDDYISKPIDAEIFKHKMQKYIVGGGA